MVLMKAVRLLVLGCLIQVLLLQQLLWSCEGVGNDDLYKILGVKKTATTREIKRAYRQKALETHPDKQKDKDPEIAAAEFHKVVEAFEILSDESSRRMYDRTGNKKQQQQRQQQQQQNSWQFTWSWSSSSGGQRRTYQRRKFNDRYTVKEAQARLLHIVSLEQLETIMADDTTDNNSDSDNDSAAGGRLERNLLLCFVTPQLEKHVMEEMGYPYPFAGMSSQGIWWEDMLQTTMVRFHRSNDLTRFFDIPNGDELQSPVFVFGRRGQLFNDKSHWTRIQTSDRNQYDRWTWQQLEISIEFINNHNHPAEIYWINGNSGRVKMTLEPGQRASHTTMLGHEWYVRDVRTDSRSDSPGRFKLSEQSSLAKWKITSDTRRRYTIPLRECYDTSGHCPWWKSYENACQTNPNFMNDVCRLTCEVCESDAREDESDFTDEVHEDINQETNTNDDVSNDEL